MLLLLTLFDLVELAIDGHVARSAEVIPFENNILLHVEPSAMVQSAECRHASREENPRLGRNKVTARRI